MDGADVAGIRVVALCGDLVGYLRTVLEAALPAFDAEFPISLIGGRGVE